LQYNIKGFIELIENHDFVEAHEVLEDDWNALKKLGDKKSAKFLQGLINGATSIALHVKGRPAACTKVWGAFERNIHLLDEVALNDRHEYVYAIDLLQKQYDNKNEFFPIS